MNRTHFFRSCRAFFARRLIRPWADHRGNRPAEGMRFRPSLDGLEVRLVPAPVVTGVTGQLAAGQTVQVSGSGFGTKAHAKPLLFADFENGIQPSPLGRQTTWNQVQNMEQAAGTGVNGTGGAQATDGNGVWTLRVDSTAPYWTEENQQVYVFRKMKQNFEIAHGSNSNWKIWRMWPASSSYPNIYAGANNGRVYVEPSTGSPPGDTGFWDSFPIETTDWMTQELVFKASSAVGVKDGSTSILYDNTTVASGTVKSRPQASDPYMSRNYVVHGVAANSSSWSNPAWSQNNRLWADDVYVDTTWSRVVLGDASTYAACRSLEIQVPSAWSDGSVSVTFRPGGFAPGSTAYVYVFDAAGNVNGTGHAVTIGDGTSPPPPPPPPPPAPATWARDAGQAGTTPDDEGRSVAVDPSGNVYVTGSYLAAGGGAVTPGDILVNKYSPGGTLLWSKQIGGSGDDRGLGLAVDSYGGHVYLTGVFQGTVDFDPGPGASTLTSAGGDDTFVMKLTKDGGFVWARQVGGTATDVALDLALDANNAPVVTGRFGGTSDFDPGAGVAARTSQGGSDLFVLKLNYAGVFQWVQTIGGTGSDRGDAVTVDGSGVYLTGSFQGTVDFDPGLGVSSLASAGGADVFVLKLDPAGSYAWARKLGGASADEGKGVAVDASGAVYAAGGFTGAADFDPSDGTLTLTSGGDYDAFLVKLSPAGSLLWARAWGGAGDDRAAGVAVGPDGAATTGWLTGEIDLDPGSGSSPVASAGARDLYVSLLDDSGNFVTGVRGGGTGDDQGLAVATDPTGGVYLTGNFTGSAVIDTGEQLVTLTSAGGKDVVTAKLTLSGSPVSSAAVAAGGPEPQAMTTSSGVWAAPIGPATLDGGTRPWGHTNSLPPARDRGSDGGDEDLPPAAHRSEPTAATRGALPCTADLMNLPLEWAGGEGIHWEFFDPDPGLDSAYPILVG